VDVETKPKRKAKDNPWYRLATLHGEPSEPHDEIAARNRLTWNRWMAPRISDDLRADLLKKVPPAMRWALLPIQQHLGWTDEELTPFSEDERRSIADQIGSPFEGEEVDFSNNDFEAPFFPQGFVFPTVTFYGATFSDRATFFRAAFSGDADFTKAAFSGDANFTNAEMKGRTSFKDVKFSEPPQCFNAKLHEGTTWPVHWPKPPKKDKDAARRFVAAYERLKQEMDRLRKHGEELDFFPLELQCRQVVLRWKGLPIALYGLLCGHGRYYMRPLGILVVVVILGAVPIRAHFGGGWSLATFTEHPIGGGALGLSFANTFGFLGVRKDLIEPMLLQSLPGWLKVIATIQTILGIVLLFLFGLGVRNRFRMR
jgi:hypothetical protein